MGARLLGFSRDHFDNRQTGKRADLRRRTDELGSAAGAVPLVVGEIEGEDAVEGDARRHRVDIDGLTRGRVDRLVGDLLAIAHLEDLHVGDAVVAQVADRQVAGFGQEELVLVVAVDDRDLARAVAATTFAAPRASTATA